MFLNLKKKIIKYNICFKKLTYYGFNINLNYSFFFFFLKKFNIFNNFYYFNSFFINYLIKLILILKIILIKKCNLLVLVKLKKKNNFLKNYFFLFNLSYFSFKINKFFDSYFYLIKWLFKKNFFYFFYPNCSLIVTFNFFLKLNSLKLVNYYNIPIICFNPYLVCQNDKSYDFFIFNNNFFFFFLIFSLI